MIRRLQPAGQEGIALAMTLLVMALSSAVLVSVIQYTSSSGRDANANHARQVAYGLAEAGVNNALSILNQAADVQTGTLLTNVGPSTYTQGTATYSGTYNATLKEWTITATGSTPNPAGGTAITRTLTRKVVIADTANGPSVTKWSRLYHDDNSSTCLTILNVNIPSPLSTRSPLCLTGTTQLTGSAISVGQTTTLAVNTNIGTSSSTPVVTFAGTSGCKWSTQSVFTSPCGSAQHVYTQQTPTTNPTDLLKPTVDFAYWYANAKPGPMHPCTTSSGGAWLPQFDSNSTYDGSNSEQELAPNPSNTAPGTSGSSSYTCKVIENGVTVGELSWNNTTRVLTIQGTVFFDGSAGLRYHGGFIVHYQGRATLYIAKTHHSDEMVCAGGSGTTSCRDTMSTWDPTTNLLVLIAGDKNSSGSTDVTIHRDEGTAFQGVIWAKNECSIKEGSRVSGPIICNKLDLTTRTSASPLLNGGFYTWPPLGTLLEGQTHGTTPLPGDHTVTPSTQTG